MLVNYTIKCGSCKESFKVKYGSVDKKVSYEVFSCSKCKNLFSIKNTDKKKCPNCKGVELIQYSPSVSDNMNFYKSMYKKGLLKKADFDNLKKFWKSFADDKCPVCGKKKLEWVK